MSRLNKHTLYRQVIQSSTLKDTLKMINRPMYGLCYSYNSCFFALYDDAQDLLLMPPKEQEPLIYEARFFDQDGELRWQQAANPEEVNAIYISELGLLDKENSFNMTFLETIEQTYIVTGEYLREHKAFPNWSCLSTERYGELWVPIKVSEGKKVKIEYKEYIGCVSDREAAADGNLRVLDERWLGFLEL